MRAVLDANVLISAALSSQGPSATLIRRCRDGALDIITSDLLLGEVERALRYPKLAKRIPAATAASYVEWLRRQTTRATDPQGVPPVSSPDAGDDYLLALAITERAFLVTGDQHLLGMAGRFPIYRPAEFLQRLDRGA